MLGGNVSLPCAMSLAIGRELQWQRAWRYLAKTGRRLRHLKQENPQGSKSLRPSQKNRLSQRVLQILLQHQDLPTIRVQVRYQACNRSAQAMVDSDKLSVALRAKQARDFKKAVSMLEPLALEGVTLAQWHLADCLENGLGQAANSNAAAVWYEHAARSDDLWFSHSLGRFYERTGRKAEAFAHIEKLAKLNYPPSVYRLGRFYEQGIGVEIDLERAHKQIDSAASMGHVFAERSQAMRLVRSRNFRSVMSGISKFAKVFWHIARIGSKNAWDPRMVN
jgi:TPR repeat protein